ncbi:MAG: hypothetical protein HY901_22850 [Deltaproteobacteria bacterium]|nr:hypothetical protein [Deltaproteobacteria bacterium]
MVEQIRNYFATGIGQVVGFLPNLLSAVIIFVVGYALSRLAGSLVRRLLARLDFDPFINRRLHPRASARRPASSTVGSAVFWLGMLVTLSLTTRSLRLVSLSGGIDRILSYVPRVIVAAFIVGIAIAVANVVADLIGGVTSTWLARGARVAIITLSVFMALDQLGIARNIVMTTFAAVVGAAAVAAALALGVGNIDFARNYTRRLERRGERRAVAQEGERRERPLEPYYPTEPGARVPPPVEPTDTGPHTH